MNGDFKSPSFKREVFFIIDLYFFIKEVRWPSILLWFTTMTTVASILFIIIFLIFTPLTQKGEIRRRRRAWPLLQTKAKEEKKPPPSIAITSKMCFKWILYLTCWVAKSESSRKSARVWRRSELGFSLVLRGEIVFHLFNSKMWTLEKPVME